MSHHHAPLSRPIVLGMLAMGSAIAAAALDTTVSAAENTSQEAVHIIELLPHSPDNPRSTEGDFIKLADGRILFVYSHFTGGGGDDATAHLAGRFSSDGGKTWTGKDTLVLPNEGDANTMSVSLLRLQDGRIALFYLRKNSISDCRPVMRISTDEAKTWSEPTLCIGDDEIGYYVLNNDRVIQLKNGRLVVPVALHNKPDWKELIWAAWLRCYFSDDAGKTWQTGKTTLKAKTADGKRIVTQEPGVVELKDGRVMMFARTTAGCQYVSYSSDGGDTWSKMKPSTMLSPCSPALIERIPGTDTLLLAWNNHEDIDAKLRDERTPFSIAISNDEGTTWQKAKNLADDPGGRYDYPAIHFEGDHVLLAHGGITGAETRITRVPIGFLSK